MDRRADEDSGCSAFFRRLWNNSFRKNDPVTTKEMGALLTSDNKVILLPSYANDATNTSCLGEYFDQQGRQIFKFYKNEETNHLFIFYTFYYV